MLVLDKWQKEVLAYDGDLLLCTGRRVGKTQIMAIKAAEYMKRHKNHQIIIASLTEDQAKLIIVMILDYLEKKYPKDIDEGKNKPTQNKIVLKNKSSCIARPVGNTGDALRGFNGHVLILDELSRFNDLIMTAATPLLLTTGGQIWGCSTPYGKKGFFWKQFDEAYNKKDPSARFKVFYKTSPEVIEEREISETWTIEQKTKALALLEKERKDMSEISFGQEYLGLFLEDLQQFFPDELINKVCVKQKQGPSFNNPSYMGCDIARMGGDQTTIEIGVWERSKFIQTESIGKTKVLTTETEKLIIEQCKIWNPVRIGIDAGAGSLGVSIYDHLMEMPEIRRRLRAMNNRQIIVDRGEQKTQRFLGEDMYFNLRGMMERGEIELLDNDDVKLSLKSVQIELTNEEDKNSKIRFHGSYTHHAEGIKRMAFLAKKEKSLNFQISYV